MRQIASNEGRCCRRSSRTHLLLCVVVLQQLLGMVLLKLLLRLLLLRLREVQVHQQALVSPRSRCLRGTAVRRELGHVPWLVRMLRRRHVSAVHLLALDGRRGVVGVVELPATCTADETLVFGAFMSGGRSWHRERRCVRPAGPPCPHRKFGRKASHGEWRSGQGGQGAVVWALAAPPGD